MEMSSANEIRHILNEIDVYKNKLNNMIKCKKLSVTINDGANGLPTTYERHSMEVEAIIKAYEKHIEDLEHRIYVMKWVNNSNE